MRRVSGSLSKFYSILCKRSIMASQYFAPSLFVNHGGGPYPVMGEKDNLEIAQSLRDVRKLIDFNQLKAIILVTAHWEADIVSISSAEKHELLFDYYNFPPETYKYKYGAKGDPALARKVHDALSSKGIPSRLDSKRGWDHGVFVPMMLIRPEADIPIVQVSILESQDASQHYEIGKVLHQFRKDGVAVIGSGLSYHNMRRMREVRNSSDGVLECVQFDAFLNEVCVGHEGLRHGLVNWEQAAEAREAHPQGKADHLMPLIVAAGAGGSARGRKVFKSIFYGKFPLSGFIWE